MSKFFNRGLKEKDKKDGVLKRLKNIEDKNEEQLKAINGKTGLKSKIDLFDEDLTLETIALIKEIISIKGNVDFEKLSFRGCNKKVYGLHSFKTFKKLIKDIRSKNMTIEEAEIKQNKFVEKLDELRAFPERGSKYIDFKENVSKNVKIFYGGWEKFVYGFKNGILPPKTDGDQLTHILDTPKQKRFGNFLKRIKEEQKYIDTKLFNSYFSYENLMKCYKICLNQKVRLTIMIN